jgi:hypothetical protein
MAKLALLKPLHDNSAMQKWRVKAEHMLSTWSRALICGSK